MAQPYEERNSAAKTRRQQEDQRRMEFRRAIEDRYELVSFRRNWRFSRGSRTQLWQAAPAASRRSAQTSALICTRSLRDKRQEGVRHR